MPAARLLALCAVLLTVVVALPISTGSIAAVRPHVCALLVRDDHGCAIPFDVRTTVLLAVRVRRAAIDQTRGVRSVRNRRGGEVEE